jgi:hypothetical protein
LLLQSVLVIPLVLLESLSLLLSLTIDISSEDDRTERDNAGTCAGVMVMVIPRCSSSCCSRWSTVEEEDEEDGDPWFIILLGRGTMCYFMICDQITSVCVCEFSFDFDQHNTIEIQYSTGGTTIAVVTKH